MKVGRELNVIQTLIDILTAKEYSLGNIWARRFVSTPQTFLLCHQTGGAFHNILHSSGLPYHLLYLCPGFLFRVTGAPPSPYLLGLVQYLSSMFDLKSQLSQTGLLHLFQPLSFCLLY